MFRAACGRDRRTPQIPVTPSAIDVVIPVCNCARYIRDAVQSALGQGPLLKNVIVVDDGSTDATSDVVCTIPDSRVKLLRTANRGPSAARNVGWKAGDACWVQFLDADDVLPAGALAALYSAIGTCSVSIPYGREAVFASDMAEPVFEAAVATRDGDILPEVAMYTHGTVFSSLVPRFALIAVGGFDEDIAYGEDYSLGIKLAVRYRCTYVPTVTYWARMHAGNRHRTFRADAHEQYFKIVREHLAAPQASWRQSWMARRAEAHWMLRFALTEWQRGNGRRARALLVRAILRYPVKIGAWKELIALCYRQGIGAPPQTGHT